MADREKVIKGLELCEIGSGDRCYEKECPYYGQGCTESLKNDILATLKEHEAVVRCKDCKYAVLTYQGELKYCKYFVDEYGFTNGGDPLYLEGDFFCAAGERQ